MWHRRWTLLKDAHGEDASFLSAQSLLLFALGLLMKNGTSYVLLLGCPTCLRKESGLMLHGPLYGIGLDYVLCVVEASLLFNAPLASYTSLLYMTRTASIYII